MHQVPEAPEAEAPEAEAPEAEAPDTEAPDAEAPEVEMEVDPGDDSSLGDGRGETLSNLTLTSP